MSAACDAAVCITCSDQLISVEVLSLSADGTTAQGRCDGVDCEVSVELIDEVCPGDVVLAHGGVALQRAPAESDAAGTPAPELSR